MLYFFASAALVVALVAVTPSVLPAGSVWLRATAALVVALAGIQALVLAAAAVGGLNPLGLTVAATALAIAAVTARARALRPVASPPIDASPEDPTLPLGAAVAGASLGLWAYDTVWHGTRFCFDDVTYHAAIPAQWVQQGALFTAPTTYQAYYPLNSELLGTWALALQGTAANAALAVGLVALLWVTASVTLVVGLGGRAGAALALCGAMLLSPSLRYFAQTYSATDLTVAALVVAALALAIGPPCRRRAALSGLAVGAALGAKVSVAPLALLLGAWWAWGAWQRRAGGDLAAFALAAAPLGGVWYLRNLWLTGNPLYPAAIGPFAGPLDPVTQRATSLVPFIVADGHRLSFWTELLAQRLDWPLPLGVAALAGLVAALVVGMRRRSPGLVLVAAVGLLFVLLHPAQPFAGTINRPRAPLHRMVRYLTLAVVLGWPLWAALRPGVAWARGVAAVGVATWLWLAWQVGTNHVALAWALALVGAGAGVGAALSRRPPGAAPAASLALVVLALCALRTPTKHLQTVDASYRFAPKGAKHEGAWRALDALVGPRRVGWLSHLSSSHAFVLPSLGQRLQHRVVPLDPMGRALPALHARDRERRDGWWWEFDAMPDAASEERVLANLRDAGVDVLLLSRCQRSLGDDWPVPRALLLRQAPERRLYADDCAELWGVASGAAGVEEAR